MYVCMYVCMDMKIEPALSISVTNFSTAAASVRFRNEVPPAP